ncbi:MAG TPA: hypothetical protein PKX87_08170, partial [Alphaproteobacteria bacterium]|nr:hypothetical protein [Alphaproteobacteria bacterium]
PFTSLTSLIRMRPFGSTQEGTLMALEAVIGQDKAGQTWGCSKIYDESTKTVLTPSEYEEQENRTPGQIAEPSTLHGRECAPVEAQRPESNATQSVPSTPSLKTPPNLDTEAGSRAVPKAPLLHL